MQSNPAWDYMVQPNEVFAFKGSIVRALPHMRLPECDECAGCIAKYNWMLCRELPACAGLTFVLHGDQAGDPADLIQEDNEIGNFPASAFRKWFIVERSDVNARRAGAHVAAALASKFQSYVLNGKSQYAPVWGMVEHG